MTAGDHANCWIEPPLQLHSVASCISCAKPLLAPASLLPKGHSLVSIPLNLPDGPGGDMFATSLHAVRKGCFATAFVICIASPAAAQPPDGAPRLIHGPASRPLHLIPPLMPPQDHHEIPLRLVPPGDTGQPQPDTALQTTILPSAPNLGYKFPGVGAGDYGYQVTSAPPDTNGDVGSTQYVQSIHLSPYSTRPTALFSMARLQETHCGPTSPTIQILGHVPPPMMAIRSCNTINWPAAG